MSNKLYVGNISYHVDEGSLEKEFANFGSVKSVKIITEYETGRSKGFGFVEMETSDEAQEAIKNLDGKEFGGRSMRVNVARERTDNRSGGGGGGSRRRW